MTLADLPAPAAPTNASGPQIAATSTGGVAAPVDTGIDQAPLSVQVLDTNSEPLPPTDPSYQRIYYRADNTNTLLTNLFPPPGGDLDTFIGISPYAGAYPNNGSAGGGGQSTTFDGFHYVATTSSIDQKIIGYLAINADQPAFSNADRGPRLADLPRRQRDVGRQRRLTGRVPRLRHQHLPARPDHHEHHHRSAHPGDVPEHHQRPPDRAAHGAASDDRRVEPPTATRQRNSRAPGGLHAPHPERQRQRSDPRRHLSVRANDRVDTNLVTHGILVPVVDVPVQ